MSYAYMFIYFKVGSYMYMYMYTYMYYPLNLLKAKVYCSLGKEWKNISKMGFIYLGFYE